MAESNIPVDLFNPGQVFACLGLVEAADVLLGDAEGGFDWRDEGDARFRVRVKGSECPVAAVLRFLMTARVRSIAPARSTNATDGWQVPTARLDHDAAFPFPDPSSPATLPALLEGRLSSDEARKTVCIDHWGDETKRDPVKFWGGGAGYPGAALTRDVIELLRRELAPRAASGRWGADGLDADFDSVLDADRWSAAIADPFNVSAEQSSSFRFDWRRDYVPIDIGFSINTQKGTIAMVGFPVVELLAAIGLGNGRPERLSKLEYRYATLGAEDRLVDLILLRAGLGGADIPLPMRRFRMQLAYPGKEGQARVITTVIEETIR